MQESARVVSIEGSVATVQPLDIEVCIGCSNSECKKNGNLFRVANSRNFPIKPGSEVKIAAPVKNQLYQAIFAVGVPVAVSACFFIAARRYIPSVGEGGSVGIALAALVASMILVYRIRKSVEADLPEIISVLEASPLDLSAEEAPGKTGNYQDSEPGDPGSGR